jgi:hypothetical protein
LQTEIVIDAPAATVWSILTDFTANSDWNPFIRRISGQLATGARLEVELAPPGGRAITMRPTIREVQPGRVLRWLGHLGAPGLFDGEHSFEIEPLGEEQVRFIQSERFSGILASLVTSLIRSSTKQGFEAMNQALKERAEVAAKSDSMQAA